MILVTSAAGLSGTSVLRALALRGLKARGFVRSQAQVQTVLAAGAADAFVGDIRDGSDARRALQGCDALHLICPRLVGDEAEIGTLWLQEARRARLRKIVYHAVSHPYLEAMPHHWDKFRVQLAIEQADLPFVVLQPTNYMRNLTWAWNKLVQERAYLLPYSADVPVTWVDSDDVAQAAAVVHQDDHYDGGVYDLCGTQGGITRHQLCALLSQKLGVEISAKVADWEDWRALARYSGWSAEQMRRLRLMFAYYDQHGFRGGNPCVLSMLLGRPATTYDQYLDRLLALPPHVRQAAS